MFRGTVAVGLLLALVSACAPVKDSCDAFCRGLCDKMKECSMGDTSETCPASCEAGLLNTSTCETARVGLPSYTCDKLQRTLDCATYCTEVCKQAASCRVVSDETACALGCVASPATCNPASIPVRSCEQISKETTCYEGYGKAPPDKISKLCDVGVFGEQGDLCRTSTDCFHDLGCLKASGTCGACTTNNDCAHSLGQYYCGKDQRCHSAQCFKDDDCKDYSGEPYCSTATYTCTACSKDCKGVCDPYAGCVQCTLDEHCDPASTCYDDHTCRKRCQDASQCGNGECSTGHCTDPVGTPCDKNKGIQCGGAHCINVNFNDLTVPAYCTRSCNSKNPCPTGYECSKTYDCVKL